MEEFLIPDGTPIESPDRLPHRVFQIVTVCSGKGGVGKTMTTVNLSVVLAAAGWKITVIDGDLGLASVKLMVPLSSTAHLGQWFLGRCKYHQLTSNTPYGFNVISAPQNEFQLQDLSDLHHVRLAKLFNMIQSTSDLLIIDNGAGISKNVMGWCHMAHRLLLVTTPDPTAMMSAYATIKAYTRDLLPQSIGIIVNQARSKAEALDTSVHVQTLEMP